MSQLSYVRVVLVRFDMSEARPVACPLDISVRLQKADNCHDGEYPYQELIGSLMYNATSKRPTLLMQLVN